MFLDRQDNKKDLELAYRKELKNQIESKRSRVQSNSVQDNRDKPAFSLISSFEKQQQERNKKKEDYYDQLRMQIEEEKRVKNEKEAEKKRKEMEDENKLRAEQQKLQEKYQEQMRREKKKKANPYVPSNQQPQDSQKEVAKQNDNQRLSKSQNAPQNNAGNVFSNLPLDSSHTNFQELPPVNLYPNRVQNEAFNYVPRKANRDNYYRQLLGQRRQLQQQTNQIAELNRVFNAERFRKKQESKGLEELRALQNLLDEKNTSSLSLNFRENQAAPVSPVPKRTNRTSNFSMRANKDTWRKLD